MMRLGWLAWGIAVGCTVHGIELEEELLTIRGVGQASLNQSRILIWVDSIQTSPSWSFLVACINKTSWIGRTQDFSFLPRAVDQ